MGSWTQTRAILHLFSVRIVTCWLKVVKNEWKSPDLYSWDASVCFRGNMHFYFFVFFFFFFFFFDVLFGLAFCKNVLQSHNSVCVGLSVDTPWRPETYRNPPPPATPCRGLRLSSMKNILVSVCRFFVFRTGENAKICFEIVIVPDGKRVLWPRTRFSCLLFLSFTFT